MTYIAYDEERVWYSNGQLQGSQNRRYYEREEP